MLTLLSILTILIVPVALSTSLAYWLIKRHNRKVTERRLDNFCNAERLNSLGVFLETHTFLLVGY
jgi:uncharacterized protein YpmB